MASISYTVEVAMTLPYECFGNIIDRTVSTSFS